jgi:hypothetical protein
MRDYEYQDLIDSIVRQTTVLIAQTGVLSTLKALPEVRARWRACARCSR